MCVGIEEKRYHLNKILMDKLHLLHKEEENYSRIKHQCYRSMDEYEVFIELKIVHYHSVIMPLWKTSIWIHPEEYGVWFIRKEKILEGFKQKSNRITFLFLVNVSRNLMENDLSKQYRGLVDKLGTLRKIQVMMGTWIITVEIKMEREKQII